MSIIEERAILKKLKRRVLFKRIFLLGVLGFLSVLATDVYLSHKAPVLMKSELPNILHAAIFFWLVILFSGVLVWSQTCPLCKNRFSASAIDRRYDAFTTKCFNCGLKQDGSNLDELYTEFKENKYITGEGVRIGIFSGVGAMIFGACLMFLGSIFKDHVFGNYCNTIGWIILIIGVVVLNIEIYQGKYGDY